MSKLVCKKCSSSHYVKNGYVQDHQRYRCWSCGYNFTDTAPRGVYPALKSLALVLYGLGGVFMNKIAKMLGVSNVAVLKWIRQEGNQLKDPVPRAESEIVMMDEMWHFVNGKKKSLGVASHPWCHASPSRMAAGPPWWCLLSEAEAYWWWHMFLYHRRMAGLFPTLTSCTTFLRSRSYLSCWTNQPWSSSPACTLYKENKGFVSIALDGSFEPEACSPFARRSNPHPIHETSLISI